MNLTDDQFGQIENLINCAIHEAVFALHHAEENQGDSALTCITQIQSNAEAAAEIIIQVQRAAGET